MTVEIPCPVYPKHMAIFDYDLRIKMNQEVYYFSSRAAKRKFEANPLHYCGRLTDPVTQKRFKPTASSPKTIYAGRPYYFAADSTRAAFLAAPDSLSVRREGPTLEF